jgi:hypothetical protein
MKNIEEKYLKIVGKTANVDLGIICTQLISIESRLQALTEFVSKNATKDEKKKLNESINNHHKEMAIMFYNLYGRASELTEK